MDEKATREDQRSTMSAPRAPDLSEVTSRLAQTASTIKTLIDPLPADAIGYREAAGTWSPFEVVCHLADAEITDWMPRVRAILSDGDRRFPPYDREAGFKRYEGWAIAAVVQEFGYLRRRNIAELATMPIAPALARTGVHPEFGSVTLHQLLSTWSTHDLAHVAQIARILVRFHGRDVGPWSKYFSLLADASAR